MPRVSSVLSRVGLTTSAALLIGGVIVAHAAPASAAVQVYTSQSAFETALANLTPLSSTFLNPFDGNFVQYTNYTASGNGFSYGIREGASPGTYISNGVLIAETTGSALVVTATGGGYRALGGNFFNTTGGGAYTSGNVTVTVSDNSGSQDLTFLATSNSDSFRGFLSNSGAISQVVIRGIDGQRAAVDNLRVGASPTVATSAPEPCSIALLLSAGIPVAGLVRRRKPHASRKCQK